MKGKNKPLLMVVMSFLLCVCMTLVACNPTSTPPPPAKTVDVESVEILNTETSFAPGSYIFTAKCLPDNSIQGITFKLIDVYQGVGLESTKSEDGVYVYTLTVGQAAIDGNQIKVQATSTYDTTKTQVKTYSLAIPDVNSIMISTEDELIAIAKNKESMNAAYKLANDIALTKEWVAIGDSEKEVETDGKYEIQKAQNSFGGILDGNGHKITNLYRTQANINKEEFNSSFNRGMFGEIGATGMIKNLGIEGDAGFHVSGWSGVIAGYNKGLIKDVYTNVKYIGTSGRHGAIVGTNQGKIENCYAIGSTTTGGAANTKGIVGVGDGEIVSCFADTDTSTITTVKAGTSLTIDATSILTTSQMKNKKPYQDAGWSEDIWHLSTTEYPMLKHPGFEPPVVVVGIAIENTDKVINVATLDSNQYQLNVSVKNSENTAFTAAVTPAVAGVSVSDTGLVTFENSFASHTEVTFTVTAAADTTKTATFKILVKNYDEATPVVISTEADLLKLATDKEWLERKIELGADIALSTNADWVGIGSTATPFSGTFDGKGYIVSGMASTKAKGFFNVIDNPDKTAVAVKRLTVVGALSGTGNFIGGFVGSHKGGIIEDCISSVNVTTTGSTSGGFVGSIGMGMADVAMRRCLTFGSVTSSVSAPVFQWGWQGYVNGAIGGACDGTIEDVYALGAIDNTVVVNSAGAEKKTLHIFVYPETGVGEGMVATRVAFKTDAEMKVAAAFENFAVGTWTFAAGQLPSLARVV